MIHGRSALTSSYSSSESRPSWSIANCVALSDQVLISILQAPRAASPIDLALTEPECGEVRGTVTYTKTALTPFVSSTALVSSTSTLAIEPAFDICLTGVVTILTNILDWFSVYTPSHTPQNLHSTNSPSFVLTASNNDVLNSPPHSRSFSSPSPPSLESFDVWKTKKILLFQLDFLLRQKTDQFLSIFPIEANGEVTPQGAAIIQDEDGRSFWGENFGVQCCGVPWDKFFQTYETQQKPPSLRSSFSPTTFLKTESDQLYKVIDCTKDSFVSAWEFSVFLKWFGPLQGSSQRVLDALNSGILCGFVPGVEANMLLDGKPEGFYIVRFSKTQPGSFAVTFVDQTSQVKHTLLHSVFPGPGLTLRNPPTIHKTLQEFVDAHKAKLKYPISAQERWGRGESVGVSLGLTNAALPAPRQQSLFSLSSSNLNSGSPVNNSVGPQEQPNNNNVNSSSRSPTSSIPNSPPFRQRTASWINPISPSSQPHSNLSLGQAKAEHYSTGTINNNGNVVMDEPKPSTSQKRTENNKDLCHVCMDNFINTVFLECGHLSCCSVCAKPLTACPFCRQPIVRVVPIFRP